MKKSDKDTLDIVLTIFGFAAVMILIWAWFSWLLFYSDSVFKLHFIPAEDIGSWVSSLALLMTLPVTLTGIMVTAKK